LAKTAAIAVPDANVLSMNRHLEVISSQVAVGAHAVILFDGAGYHRSARLKVPTNLTLIRLPRYAPELNSIENVWEYLRKNKLANTIYKTYADILDKACEAWRFFDANKQIITSITHRDWAAVN
jgi:hypothetical protein